MTFNFGATGSPFERGERLIGRLRRRALDLAISSIPITPAGAVPTVLVNHSTDDGRTWSDPVSLPPPAAKNVNLDETWTVCANNTASPFRGHCYTELTTSGPAISS